jgi:hypothetical protein
VVPYNYSEHRYSVAYFLRAEDETMFQDSEGRFVTARTWHDEKFLAFLASPADQAAAPSSMLLGGMQEDETDVYSLPQPKPVAADATKSSAVEVTAVEVSA